MNQQLTLVLTEEVTDFACLITKCANAKMERDEYICF